MKKSSTSLQKVTLNLFAGDFDALRDAYPQIGAGAAIRELVHQHLQKIERAAKPASLQEVEI